MRGTKSRRVSPSAFCTAPSASSSSICANLGCIRLQPGCIELYGCSLYCMRLQPRGRVSAPTGSRTGTSSRLAARQGSCTRARPGAAGCPRPPIRRGTSRWPRCRRCAAPRPAGRCCRSRRGRSQYRCPSRARQRSSTAAPCLQLITVQQRISAAARACWAPGSSGLCISRVRPRPATNRQGVASARHCMRPCALCETGGPS